MLMSVLHCDPSGILQHQQLRAYLRLVVCSGRAVGERKFGGGGAHYCLIVPSTPLGPLVPPADAGPCVPAGHEDHLSRARSAKLYVSSDSMLAANNHGTGKCDFNRTLSRHSTALHISSLEYFHLDKPVLTPRPTLTPLTPTLTLASTPNPVSLARQKNSADRLETCWRWLLMHRSRALLLLPCR